MVASTKVTGIKTRSQDTVSTSGTMDVHTRVTGWKTICMDKVCICGPTAENTKENM